MSASIAISRTEAGSADARTTSPSTRGRSIPPGFAGAAYQEQATLAREAPDLLQDGPTVRRSMIEEGAAFYAELTSADRDHHLGHRVAADLTGEPVDQRPVQQPADDRDQHEEAQAQPRQVRTSQTALPVPRLIIMTAHGGRPGGGAVRETARFAYLGPLSCYSGSPGRLAWPALLARSTRRTHRAGRPGPRHQPRRCPEGLPQPLRQRRGRARVDGCLQALLRIRRSHLLVSSLRCRGVLSSRGPAAAGTSVGWPDHPGWSASCSASDQRLAQESRDSSAGPSAAPRSVSL